ncbi:nuclear transport factor 2 family protein [Chryseobacterium sp. Leaf394]|uniref:nuclear transport factor 2 family protein n=1 Tax=Chryseobacterium sp. Leaf394 TaxID=1736361 RepID=UPI000B035CE2|nr:nuclear transport factor 2 family protein [Chryseobacterium sp. Leaf394]
MWTFVGDQTLSGKDEVRKYIADAYKKPPHFDTRLIIAEGNYVAVMGKISLWENESAWKDYDYCDLWRFENGKMAELKAFVTAR